MNETLLQFIYAPILLGIGGFVSWLIKSKTEELKATREKLREDRLKIYEEILEPYVILLNGLDEHSTNKAIKKITSEAYRKSSIKVSLFGSDRVVGAYNKLMENFYTSDGSDPSAGMRSLRLYAQFLLEIRNDLGNTKSALDAYEMLKPTIKDIHKYESEFRG